jgi:hypothetical protein
MSDTKQDSKQLPVTSDATTSAVSRDNLGQFVKGVSGNPDGRPKGSKNRTQLMKQAMEEALTRELSNDFMDILQQALTMAKDGDKDMIKLVLNDFMKEVRRAEPPEEAKADTNIEISITQYFGPDGDKNAAADAIEAEFEEVQANTGLTKPS